MNIRYLTYNEIDKTSWDKCIVQATNSLIYAHSSCLDGMAEHWDALVLGDYEAVMPLTWKRKWGIKYLYQPPFLQQGGIFFKQPLPAAIIEAFIEKAVGQFKFAEVTLNFANNIFCGNKTFQLSPRNNFFLNLNASYAELYDNYQQGFTKSLRRIKKFDLKYAESGNHKSVIELSRKLYSQRLRGVTAKNYLQFEKLCAALSATENVVVRQVFNKENILVAAVVLLKDKNRLYNIVSCITETGKKLEANYFLYDRLINEFAGSGLLLDFEGSDIQGIAAFYKKFNPENQPYSFLKYNQLPFLLRKLKA